MTGQWVNRQPADASWDGTLSMLVDDFSNPATLGSPGTVWQNASTAPGTAVIAGGVLTLSSGNAESTAGEVYLPATFNPLTSSAALSGATTPGGVGHVHLELVSVTADDNAIFEADLYVQGGEDEGVISTYVNGGRIWFQFGSEFTDVAYDPVAHRWWRWRMTATPSVIIDLSPDAVTWTELYTILMGIPIEHVGLDLYAPFTSIASVAVLDNLNVSP